MGQLWELFFNFLFEPFLMHCRQALQESTLTSTTGEDTAARILTEAKLSARITTFCEKTFRDILQQWSAFEENKTKNEWHS